MPVPAPIHFVAITVEQIDRAATIFDPDAREPIQHANRKTQTIIPGQPHWGSLERLRVEAGGPSSDAQGWVTFRFHDLDALGLSLQINDRFVQMGRLSTEVYIVRLEPKAPYPDQNGASLLRAWFADRAPSKERS